MTRGLGPSLGTRKIPFENDELVCLPPPTSWRSWSGSLGRALVVGRGEVMLEILCLMLALFGEPDIPGCEVSIGIVRGSQEHIVSRSGGLPSWLHGYCARWSFTAFLLAPLASTGVGGLKWPHR